MKPELPRFDEREFAGRIGDLSPHPLAPSAIRALFAHYRELQRWNQSLSLIGPGTVGEVLERHYGESLAAIPLLEPPGRLLDVGSGGGFPGFVLAAACPEIDVFLVEARQRKWAFLRAAARRAGLPLHCLHARIELPLPRELPDSVKFITLRAIRLETRYHSALAQCLEEDGRMLVWCGKQAPPAPEGLGWVSELPLSGSESRRILVATRMPKRR